MSPEFDVFQEDAPDFFIESLREVDEVACDIETSGLDWRTEEIGTIQIYSPGSGACVIKFRPGQGVPVGLKQIMESPSIVKVFHHAAFDLAFLRSRWGIRARSIACTKIASKISAPGLPNEQHSLKHLLGRYLGVSIDKEQQRSNWLSSTLTREQLEYAVTDVVYLLRLRHAIEDEIGNRKLDALYGECLRFLPSRVELEVGGWPDVFSY